MVLPLGDAVCGLEAELDPSQVATDHSLDAVWDVVILYGYSDEIVRNVYKVQPSPARLLSDCFSLTWICVSSGLGLLCVPGIP